MIKWLDRFFSLFRHNWEIQHTVNITDELTYNPIGVVYILKCTKCGDMKKFKCTI